MKYALRSFSAVLALLAVLHPLLAVYGLFPPPVWQGLAVGAVLLTLNDARGLIRRQSHPAAAWVIAVIIVLLALSGAFPPDGAQPLPLALQCALGLPALVVALDALWPQSEQP